MVLCKRNANGEFVAWNSSSQASSGSVHDPEDLPPLKRPRLSGSQNLGSTSNISETASGKDSLGPSKSSPSPSFGTYASLAAASDSRVNTPRFSSADFKVISNSINPFIPNARNILAAPAAPEKTPTSSQSALSSSGVSSTHLTPPMRGRTKAAPFPVMNFSAPIITPPQPSGSSSYLPPSSQPTPSAPTKRGRKKAATGATPAPKPEKRGAIFKKKCPQNILDRVERVMTQRIFMIDRNRVDGELKEQFSVLGSTGNVYTVTIDHKPRCNCPDASKGNHCKHILFIFLKVLQVTQASGYWYQKALLTTELEDIFAHAPLAPNSLAHPHVREAYAHATGKAPSASTSTAAKKKRVPGPDDDCPICYDGMHGVAETSLAFCEDCGNALHKECFGQWQRTAASSGKDLTCVWCRAPWVLPYAGDGGARVAGARRAEGGYLNLAGVGNAPPVRDTTTYYHGPRRGHRYYGYQQYGDD